MRETYLKHVPVLFSLLPNRGAKLQYHIIRRLNEIERSIDIIENSY